MRALARWSITPLLAAPLGAWALGLGDIELQSALNQPFRAQIGLVATADELQGLKIALAEPEMFQRRGLDRPSFLSRLEFRVATNSAGRPVVQVSSRESVAEPFVTLLVEATWARGRQTREYTVLLDPPVLLPGPAVNAPVQPAQTRPAAPNVPGGAIDRPAPTQGPAPRQTTAPAPAAPPRTQPAPGAPRATSTSSPGGTYGPVQRAETLWAIAERFRPDGVSMNQMMVATYRANPQAFGGNMNVLRAGATLRLPESSDLQELATTVATAEVQRQTDEWLSRSPQQGTLRLLPAAEPAAAAPEPARQAPPSRAPAPTPANAAPAVPPSAAASNAEVEESRRLVELRNQQLRDLQQQAANAPAEQPPANAPAGEQAPAPGVDLEPDRVFTDETPPAEAASVEAAPAPAPTPAAPVRAPQGPSLVSQILNWVTSPVLWIAVGVAALLLTALWYVRRRRQEPEDLTGRWEALESEVDDDEVREATERMRRQIPEESIVVEEAARPARRGDAEQEPAAPEPRRASAPRSAARAAAVAPADETLSSQTVINLDQADPVAEADFHMAYGLYDQAAELVQKALEAAPNRHDLKLKLLEVYFVWGNKDSFLSAAQSLRKEIGQKPDSDWDKVVIMGKQICPDERLFAESTSAGGQVDVDLQAGDSPLDLAFDDAEAGSVDLDLGLGEADGDDLDLETSGTRKTPALKQGAAKPASKHGAKQLDSSLDIGERTAAGLEAAFFELGDTDKDASQTTPELAADSLAATQESPTIESPRTDRDWATVEIDPTVDFSVDAPTVETPTIESPGPDAPTMETPTVETPFRRTEPPTVEQPALASSATELTAEIDLDDLGLDVEDLEGLPQDLGDLPMAGGAESDTREQPALHPSEDLLSATGVTQVLRGGDQDEDNEEFEQRKTSVLSDEDATMLAPGFGDNTLTGTEVLEHRFALDGESGDTSLVKSLTRDDNLDLNLDDLSAALHGADTVEQPRSSSFSNDVFGGGATPLDMDIGNDLVGSDDPTGTEEVSPLDPQTMTEVGTKLDLARAYIDMGDPEGARSILEEVLDEGDPTQRREAQSLIDVLSA